MIAFVFKRGRKFSAKIRMPGELGAPKVFALETTDIRTARFLLQEMVKDRFAEQRGEITPRKMREAAQRHLNELLEQFLAATDARGREKSEGTRAKYRSNIATLSRACGWVKLCDVTRADAESWAKKCGLKPKTRKDVVATMKTFCRWLVVQKLLAKNLLDGLVGGDTRFDEPCRRALSPDEQQRFLSAAPHFRSVVYLFALETMARRNEIHLLRVGDFTFDTPKPFVRLPASITKNRKVAVIYLRPHVVDAVHSILPPNPLPSEWVFHGRVPRTSTIVRDLLRAGIPFENERGRVDFHSFRMTSCTTLLNNGAPARTVQQMMRHSDIRLTMKNYTDPSQLGIAAAQEMLPVLAVSGLAKTRSCDTGQYVRLAIEQAQ